MLYLLNQAQEEKLENNSRQLSKLPSLNCNLILKQITKMMLLQSKSSFKLEKTTLDKNLITIITTSKWLISLFRKTQMILSSSTLFHFWFPLCSNTLKGMTMARSNENLGSKLVSSFSSNGSTIRSLKYWQFLLNTLDLSDLKSTISSI